MRVAYNGGERCDLPCIERLDLGSGVDCSCLNAMFFFAGLSSSLYTSFPVPGEDDHGATPSHFLPHLAERRRYTGHCGPRMQAVALFEDHEVCAYGEQAEWYHATMTNGIGKLTSGSSYAAISHPVWV